MMYATQRYYRLPEVYMCVTLSSSLHIHPAARTSDECHSILCKYEELHWVEEVIKLYDIPSSCSWNMFDRYLLHSATSKNCFFYCKLRMQSTHICLMHFHIIVKNAVLLGTWSLFVDKTVSSKIGVAHKYGLIIFLTVRYLNNLEEVGKR